ncbi:MAG: hypothetical protein AAF517_10795, partial [Planctomycetota bacterium]
CYADETSVPAVLSGPQDLNFDSDSLDVLDNESQGSDLRLVPIEIVAKFEDHGRPYTVTAYRLVTKTTD